MDHFVRNHFGDILCGAKMTIMRFGNTIHWWPENQKDDTDDLAPKLTLISSVLMITLTTCLILDKKLIDSYRRQNDVTQASSLASYPTQNGSDDYLVGDDYEVNDRRRHELIDQKALSIWQILIIIIATGRLNIVPSGSFREFWSNQSEKFVRSLVMLRTLV